MIVLDAATELPSSVCTPAREASTFSEHCVALLDQLSSTMVTSATLANELATLADVACAHARSFEEELPGTMASSRAVARADADHTIGEVAPEHVRYDEFFGIHRVDQLNETELARSIFATFSDVLADLSNAQLGLHELIALLRGMAAATAWVERRRVAEVEAIEGSPLVAMNRFRLGHLAFALFCNFGTFHLQRARRHAHGEIPTEELVNGARFIRASTAAMWYSVAFPRYAYAEQVRPLMDAASTRRHGFSGLDNFDFRRLRESWEELHGVLIDALALQPSAELRQATHLLYETIVQDNEHHTLIAAEMVGLLPSLKFERMASHLGIAAVPAVAALRMNTDERRRLLEDLASG